MTPDERAQLIEDIKTSDNKRREIVERAETDLDFDLVAAWEGLDEMEASIAQRIQNARKNE